MTPQETSNTMAFKRFVPRDMKTASVCLLVAKRGSGKSVLARDILFHKRHAFTAGVVCSPTEDSDPHFSKFIPPVLIYDDFDTNAIEKLISRQRKLCKLGKATPVFVVLDDCAFDKKNMNSKVMKKLLYNGRHYHIFCLICVQYLHDVSPGLRANVDYVFVLRENMYRDKLYKNFFSMVPNLATFNSIMDAVTSDFGCLVLDNTGNSNNLTEFLYHYKSDRKLKPFKMCSQQLWRLSEKRFNKEYDPEDEATTTTTGKPKKEIVTIKKL
jgi:hypothetical protein